MRVEVFVCVRERLSECECVCGSERECRVGLQHLTPWFELYGIRLKRQLVNVSK